MLAILWVLQKCVCKTVMFHDEEITSAQSNIYEISAPSYKVKNSMIIAYRVQSTFFIYLSNDHLLNNFHM